MEGYEMKIKVMMLVGLFLMGLMFLSPQEAKAQSINSDAEILFINETESFATVVIREVSTGTRIELRLESNHPNKNSIMAILLTAVSLDEIVRVRWQEGSPPLLKRVAINRL